MPRIVSLIASATEIVHALGFGDQLVGCSHECDYPSAVAGLPRLTAPKLDAARPSAEIDRQVRDLLRDALAVYAVDADALKALAPDVIITQTQCEVCAVGLADVEAAVASWLTHPAAIVSLQPDGLADIWSDISRVAEALEAREAGTCLIRRLQDRIAGLAEEVRALGAPCPKIACIEWIDPLMAAGNWVPELAELAGGSDPFGEAGRHAPGLEWSRLCVEDPEVVITMPCGFDIERTFKELPALTGRAGWDQLRAVREGQVFVTDGNQFFNRPGPRVVESLEILVEILHPQAFDFGHRGSGWVALGE